MGSVYRGGLDRLAFLSHSKEAKKMKFKELSWPCKVGIIGGWVILVYFALAFLSGLILAFVNVGG